MPPRRKISQAVISCRNLLLSGRLTEHVLHTLEAVLLEIDAIEDAAIKITFERCVAIAIDQVKASDLRSAGLILNLIHNLPLDTESRLARDVDYFLSVELLTFLEHYDEVRSSRQVALFVCAMLNAGRSEQRHGA